METILSSKRGLTPTNIEKMYETRTRSEVHEMKAIYISAQYAKACRRKVRKIVYF